MRSVCVPLVKWCSWCSQQVFITNERPLLNEDFTVGRWAGIVRFVLVQFQQIRFHGEQLHFEQLVQRGRGQSPKELKGGRVRIMRLTDGGKKTNLRNIYLWVSKFSVVSLNSGMSLFFVYTRRCLFE